MRLRLMGLAVLLVLTGSMALAQQNDNVFTCSSDDGQLHSCRVDTNRPIEFVRQRSDAQCIQGESYGIDRGGVWVTNGCRADFAVLNGDQAYNQGTYNNDGDYRANDGYRDENGNWHRSRHHHHDRDNAGTYSQNDPYNNGTYDRQGTYQGPYNNGGYIGSNQQHPSVYYGKYKNGRTTCSAEQGAGQTYCQTDGALSDATIVRQNGNCQRGQNWDINPDGLWVADGCSAEFKIQR